MYSNKSLWTTNVNNVKNSQQIHHTIAAYHVNSQSSNKQQVTHVCEQRVPTGDQRQVCGVTYHRTIAQIVHT